MKRAYKRRPGSKPPGRPPKTDGRQKFTTKLRPKTVELLREIGNGGGANEGIERLVAQFRDRLYANDPQAQAEYKSMTEQQYQGE